MGHVLAGVVGGSSDGCGVSVPPLVGLSAGFSPVAGAAGVAVGVLLEGGVAAGGSGSGVAAGGVAGTIVTSTGRVTGPSSPQAPIAVSVSNRPSLIVDEWCMSILLCSG